MMNLRIFVQIILLLTVSEFFQAQNPPLMFGDTTSLGYTEKKCTPNGCGVWISEILDLKDLRLSEINKTINLN
jgi:hypothetical protein